MTSTPPTEDYMRGRLDAASVAMDQLRELRERAEQAEAQRDNAERDARIERTLREAAEANLEQASADFMEVRRIVFQGGQDGESVRRELIKLLWIEDGEA